MNSSQEYFSHCPGSHLRDPDAISYSSEMACASQKITAMAQRVHRLADREFRAGRLSNAVCLSVEVSFVSFGQVFKVCPPCQDGVPKWLNLWIIVHSSSCEL